MNPTRYLALVFAIAHYALAGAADWKINSPFAIPLADDSQAAAVFVDPETLLIAAPGNPPRLSLYAILEKTGPQPNPQPRPQPEPTPTPRGPLTLIWIEETAERTPAQAAAITDAELRRKLAAAGWTLRIADADVVDENGQPPHDLATFIDAARRRGLPSLFALDAAGAEIYAGKAPANRQEFAALLERLGLKVSTATAHGPGQGAAADATADTDAHTPAEVSTNPAHGPGQGAAAACPTGTCQPAKRWSRISR